MPKPEREAWSDSGLTRAARWLLLGTAFVPLVFYRGVIFPYITTRALLFRVLVGLAALLLLWQLLTREVELADGRDPVLWGLVAWVAAGFLSAVLGPATHHSFYGDMERMWALTQWGHLALFYALVRVYFDAEWWRKFLRASLMVSVAVGLYAAGQFALAEWQGLLIGVERVRQVPTEYASTLGNPGYLGIYGVVHLAVVGVLWRGTSSLGWRSLYLVAAAANGASLLLSGSRAAYVAFAAGVGTALVLLGWSVWRERGGLPWRRIGIATGGSALVLFLLWGTGLLRGIVGATGLADVASLLEGIGTGTFRARLVAWEAAVEGFLRRPLTGWGIENFHFVWDRFADPELYRIGMPANWDRAHNVFFGALAEAGTLGLLAYGALWTAIAGLVVRAWRSDAATRSVAGGLTMAAVACAIFLFFWFEDLNASFLFLALLAFARWKVTGGDGLVRIGAFRPATVPRRRWLRRGVAAAIVVVAGGLLWRAANTARAAREVVEAAAARSAPEALSHFEAARTLRVPQARTVATEYAAFVSRWGRGASEALRRGRNREIFGEAVARAEEAVNRRIAEAPGDDRLLASRADLAIGAYAGTGAEEAYRVAEESLGEAIRIAPNRLDRYLTLAAYRQAAGRTDSARRATERALDRYDRYGEVHYRRSRIEAGAGELRAAVRWLRRVYWLGHTPEPAEYAHELARRLAAREEYAAAASVGTHYFAARYLEAAWTRFPGEGRSEYLSEIGLPRSVGGYATYGIAPRDLYFLRTWTEHLCRAGQEEASRLAARLVGNGLPPRHAGPFIAGAGRCGDAAGVSPPR